MHPITLTVVRVAAFAATLGLWRWAVRQAFSPLLNVVCIVGTVVAVFPTVWLGRRCVDRRPTLDRLAWVTRGVHAVLMVLFGVAIIKALQTGGSWRGVVIPIPRALGMVLVYITGAVTLLTVVNLAVRGLGAPKTPFLWPGSARAKTHEQGA